MKLTTRQWELYNFIKNNDGVSQEDICQNIAGYVWNDNPKVHDNCLSIWRDVEQLNNSPEIEKVIIRNKENLYKLCETREEILDYVNGQKNKLIRAAIRLRVASNKLKLDGQMKIISTKDDPIDGNSQARDFVETFKRKEVR